MKTTGTLWFLTLALLTAGCGGDSTGPQVLNIGGTWQFSSNISNSASGISCTSSGTATINQSGSNFTGTANATQGVCTDSFGGSIDNTGSVSITGGSVTGNQVSFHMPNCQSTGTITGSPPNQMSGTETCTIAVSGTNYVFTGPWQASR